MGLVITNYPVVFDVDKFDWSIDPDDPFPGESQNDFSDIIDEVGTNYTLIQQSDTTDPMGNVTAVSETSFTARGYLQHITLKDRTLHAMGLAVPGNIKGFFKHEYTGSKIIIEGDILEDDENKKWRIVTILGERFITNTEVFKVLILRNIDNEATN